MFIAVYTVNNIKLFARSVAISADKLKCFDNHVVLKDCE